MTDKFYRLYGDVSGYEGGTGVARVTTTDSTTFGPAFLKTTGVVGYNAGFDFDGDGGITTTDSTPFGPRFLSTWSLNASGFAPTI